MSPAVSRDPADDLRAIAFCLERALEPSYRVRAFRTAAAVVDRTPADELADRAPRRHAHRADRHRQGHRARRHRVAGRRGAGLPAARADAGRHPGQRGRGGAARGAARATATPTPTGPTAARRSRRWPAPARALGHEYMVLTDHSPRLTVANGLTAERLLQQLDVVADVNARSPTRRRGLAPPFRLLTGIECDIHEDGSLDQEPGAARPARRRRRERPQQAADGRATR